MGRFLVRTRRVTTRLSKVSRYPLYLIVAMGPSIGGSKERHSLELEEFQYSSFIVNDEEKAVSKLQRPKGVLNNFTNDGLSLRLIL